MKKLLIQKINPVQEPKDLGNILKKGNITYQTLNEVNWSDYPYKPDVKFAIAHDGKNIYCHWIVNEQEIKAVSTKDFGEIWKDSCVEFFVAFDDSTYYNIETNCIGKMLIGTGKNRHNRGRVPKELVSKVKRWSSLGTQAIQSDEGIWELSLIIPSEVFHLNKIENLSKVVAKGNFYKCGDDLKTPHFISWNKIDSPTPDFHLPVFFGNLAFE